MPHPGGDAIEHYIICGFGRVGHEVAAGLHHRGRHVVAIDLDASVLGAVVPDLRTIKGDATEDAVLTAAGITRARGLVASTGNDTTNLAITLCARALNPDVRLVARANYHEAEAKLLRAGATRVVLPYAIGGHRMAAQLVSPGVLAFLDAIRDVEKVDLWIEEATLTAHSALVGRRIEEVLPRSPGLPNLIALRRAADGRFVANPPPHSTLTPDDTLIVVGSRVQLERLITAATTPPPTGPGHS